jgi:plastocyanin
MNVPRPVLLALSGVVMLLAGCSNDEPPAIVDHDAVLRLTLDEYRIEPQVVTVHAISNPAIVRIVARNTGHLTHNVHVESTDSPKAPGTDPGAVDFGGTATAQPGQTVKTGLLLLPPGRYRLTCTISNHDNLGQHGILLVEPPKTTP